MKHLSVPAAFLLVLAPGFFVTHAQLQKDAEAWWSLQPIRKPAVPEPFFTNETKDHWRQNPIDRFVLAKLLEKGMTPAPLAARRTLLRRVTIDLTGLPPTPEALDAFEKDSSVHAYEKVVDALLASPRYGERWARHWMDVIHWAETHGHDQDVPREHAWPYRDYLIDSFNADKPFARFIEEQIAGDVLPSATPNPSPPTPLPKGEGSFLHPSPALGEGRLIDPRGIVAMGFLAAGPWDESSLRDIRDDSIDRKAGQYLDRDDMIGTVSYAFLSATVQCARCHDHKFDPISQEEYFQLQAVFAGVDRGNRPYEADPKARENRIRLSAKKAELQSGPKAAEKYVKDQAIAVEIAAWEKSRQDAKDTWRILDPDKFTSKEGATPTKLADASILFGGARPEKDTYVIEAVTDLPQITALCLEVLCDDSLPMKGPGRQDNGNFHLNEIRVEAAPATEATQRRALVLTRATADFNQQGWEIQRAIDGNRDSAWGVFPAVGQPHRAVFVLKEPLKANGKTRLVFTLEQTHGRHHLIGRPRLSVSASPPGAEFSPLSPAVEAILAKSQDARTLGEKTELTWQYLKTKVEADLAALPPAKLVYAAGNDFLPDGSFKPHKGCRPVHLLRRGDIKRPAKEIGPGALSMVSGPTFDLAKPDDESARRLALAKWISSPKNPLTWRSVTNRVWHYHFGRGLVSTPSDFGRMGAKPTHPELLDWLAATLLEDGGSVKKLHRRIVTSATYKQSSRHHPEFAKRDADNAYLWRMPRSRLDAETLRDAVLLLSGKLDQTMGGPSVKHFQQSPGIHRTPKVEYQNFDPDSPGAHRRSIYRFVFRTVPDPFLDALDCPDASQFTAMRATSITAQQALSLLNDTFMVRMSEHLAKRLERADGVPERIRHAYRLVLLREPTKRELELFVQYSERHGLANACRMLLNTNEFLFVE